MIDASAFTGLGLEINLPIAIITIVFSSAVFGAIKEKTDGSVIHVLIPFLIAVIVTMIWAYSNDGGISRKLLWDGLWNGVVSVGMYSPIESFLRKQGWIKE